MCNLSEWVEEQGIEKGIEKGIKKMVINFLKLGTVKDEDIMKAADISREQLEEIKKEIAELE